MAYAPVKLSDEQNRVVDQILSSNKTERILGGYAGTGKTTVIRELNERLGGTYAICALAGKAANVLRRKGLHASTIHSLIYTLEEDDKGNTVFRRKGRHELIYNGIIVDEYSMVNDELTDDLLSFKLPLIEVGDHGQLEPIGEGLKNKMSTPDWRLETIHRNAGEIAYFCEHLRLGRPALDFKNHPHYTGQGVVFLTKDQIKEHLVDTDQIICAYNKTRVSINTWIRHQVGNPPEHPVPGDRVICLKSKKDMGIFNGLQGEVLQWRYPNTIQFSRDDGQPNQWIQYDPDQFNNEKGGNSLYDRSKRGLQKFDYAYCITTHKAQGDEWDSVMVIEQKCDLWDHKRWTYTAASRAREKLYWVNE